MVDNYRATKQQGILHTFIYTTLTNTKVNNVLSIYPASQISNALVRNAEMLITSKSTNDVNL